jgi:hypothetical protein
MGVAAYAGEKSPGHGVSKGSTSRMILTVSISSNHQDRCPPGTEQLGQTRATKTASMFYAINILTHLGPTRFNLLIQNAAPGKDCANSCSFFSNHS